MPACSTVKCRQNIEFFKSFSSLIVDFLALFNINFRKQILSRNIDALQYARYNITILGGGKCGIS